MSIVKQTRTTSDCDYIYADGKACDQPALEEHGTRCIRHSGRPPRRETRFGQIVRLIERMNAGLEET